jgi:SAM-dependent methyltransferase
MIEQNRTAWDRSRRALRAKIGSMLPPDLRERLRKRFPAEAPRVGHVRWGDLRRTMPISRSPWGRGLPIDRYYVETFLAANAADIAGRVLEIKDSTYTRRFGEARVTTFDVLDIDADNPRATVISDLNAATNLPGDAFDCLIITQTFQFIFDVDAAIRELHRSLKPGGVLLATVPGIAPMDEILPEFSYWMFTVPSMRRLFERYFLGPHLTVQSHGNVLSAIAGLQGLSVDELRPEELTVYDPDFPVLVTVRGVKS